MFDMDIFKNIVTFIDRLKFWRVPMSDEEYKTKKNKPRWWKRNCKKRRK